MKKNWFRQQNISYILLSVFFVCSSFYAKSQERDKKQVIFNQEKFKPYMAIHENPGCPENSYCSKKIGKAYSKWINLLNKTRRIKKLNQYRQKNGIPVEAWSSQKHINKENIILWDSSCQLHNKENNIFKEAIIFTKNKLIPKSKNIFFEKIFLLTSKNIIAYPIIRGERPIYMNGDKFIFLKEENGKYYGLSVDPKKNIRIVKTIRPKTLPEEIHCPASLQKKYNQKIGDKLFYEGYQCQKIWNKKTNKYNLIMFGLTCF